MPLPSDFLVEIRSSTRPPLGAWPSRSPRSWSPQSHLSEPNRSPVRQAECSRTKGRAWRGPAGRRTNGDLIAQLLAAAEDHELVFGRAHRRHGRAASDSQALRLGRGGSRGSPRLGHAHTMVGSRSTPGTIEDRHDAGGHEGEPGELQRGRVETHRSGGARASKTRPVRPRQAFSIAGQSTVEARNGAPGFGALLLGRLTAEPAEPLLS